MLFLMGHHYIKNKKIKNKTETKAVHGMGELPIVMNNTYFFF